jgi:hypothetical protein
LGKYDWAKFHQLKPRLIEAVDRMLAEEIAHLSAMISAEAVTKDKEPMLTGKLIFSSFV